MEKLRVSDISQGNSKNLSHALNEVKDAASDSILKARDRVYSTSKDAAQKIDQSAHRNPWAYVGGAALVSALAGFFLGRRTKY